MSHDAIIRDIDWGRDRTALLEFNASFTTDTILKLEIGPMSARFCEERLAEPILKRYDLSCIESSVRESGLALMSESHGRTAAFMTVKYENWNRRAWLTHLYVAPEFRGFGIGTRLVAEALRFAKGLKARGLWLETQNVNYPAIRYYQSLGFQFCGFDRFLYDPAKNPGEIALYFCLDLAFAH